jgi:hypothetical protein
MAMTTNQPVDINMYSSLLLRVTYLEQAVYNINNRTIPTINDLITKVNELSNLFGSLQNQVSASHGLHLGLEMVIQNQKVSDKEGSISPV